jgi:ubiquinone/menaquinone biosynthesis C-methylase UbiE
MPDWIKAPVHRALRKYTSVRVDEIQALQERLRTTENILRFVAADETHRWLYENRLERMDATLDLFDAKRRAFHLDRYRFACRRVKGKRVLDCATGTGYGVRLLREIGNAASVIGVDIDPRATDYGRRNHQVGSTWFICSSADRLALPDGCIDIIVSFETLEHVPDDGALIGEFYRVLRPEGLLIVSTPNQWPLADAPFHVREYDRQSFEAVLAPGFDCLEIYNQNSGSETPLNRGQARGIVATSAANEQLAECFMAVCRRK